MTFGFEQPADVSGKASICMVSKAASASSRRRPVRVVLALPGSTTRATRWPPPPPVWRPASRWPQCRPAWRSFRGLKGRLQRRAALHGALLLDDTYNANPDSVRAGIDVLAATIGKKVLVLGDMGEIGEMSGQFHDEIGGYAKSQGIDRLLALGEASALAAHNFGSGGEHYTNIDKLIAALPPS
jgi:UDP-N-acetylmuramoyl-tripeptide--D-alanyl-D-alanine ligase